MTVKDLIDQLKSQDPDADVYVAYQPSYPLAAECGHVETNEDPEDEDGTAVWITVGGDVGYAPEGIYG